MFCSTFTMAIAAHVQEYGLSFETNDYLSLARIGALLSRVAKSLKVGRWAFSITIAHSRRHCWPTYLSSDCSDIAHCMDWTKSIGWGMCGTHPEGQRAAVLVWCRWRELPVHSIRRSCTESSTNRKAVEQLVVAFHGRLALSVRLETLRAVFWWHPRELTMSLREMPMEGTKS